MPSSPMTPAQAFSTAIELHQTGRLAEAIELYRQLLPMGPENADLHHLLGLALHQTGKDDEAIPLFERAIALSPQAVDYLANFAELWRKQEKYHRAIECYRRVLALRPDDLEIRYLFAQALAKQNAFDESIAELHRCMAAGRQDADVWTCLCETLRRSERLDEAVEAAGRAVELDPNSPSAWHSLGWTMMRRGQVREAMPYIDRAIQLKPDWPLSAWRRGWGHLLLGDWERGWPDYEARWFDAELQLKSRRNLPGKVWRGEDLSGKMIYVHQEQGLGDFIQFVRYVPLLQARGASIVKLETSPEFVSLVRRSFPDVELVTTPDQKVEYHYYVPIMSLPLAFNTTVATTPNHVPYLKSDPAAVERWRQRLSAHPGLKVGLTWAGNTNHANDKNRSIALKQLAEWANVPGIRFVSLQKGAPAAQASEVPEMNLLNWTDELNNFDDTAALLGALDLAIAVDTSVAHLSGALARPTWTLLNLAPDFRWMLDREDTPWYPTMRLFRQPAQQDWDSVIQRVGEELRRLALA